MAERRHTIHRHPPPRTLAVRSWRVKGLAAVDWNKARRGWEEGMVEAAPFTIKLQKLICSLS